MSEAMAWELDQPQITTKDEWRTWMQSVRDAPPRPQRLTRRERGQLSRAACDDYDGARLSYHSRFGPVRHRDYSHVFDEVLA